MRRALVPLVVIALVAPAASTLAAPATQPVDGSMRDCSPPCGEINPRILFDFEDLDKDPIALENGESTTFQGEVTFWTDTDDETHAPANPDEPIVISFSFPRLPAWAQMSIEPTSVEVPVNSCAECFQTGDDGTVHFAYSTPIELTVEAVDTPEVTTGYEYGKLQVFAKSTESTIYNPGYGIREVRVQPGQADDLEAQSSDEGEPSAVPGAGALAAIAATAAALALRRRH